MLKNVYILFILICFGVVSVKAQIIQLGSGANETAIDEASPVNIWYRRFVSQFVYTAAEINTAGGSSTNPLTQLGFYVTQSPIYSIPGYTIKIKHTTANNVTNALGTGGWTTVVNSFTYAPVAGGYDMLEFDTPFLWDGTSNIAVEICCSQVTPNYDQSGTVRYYNTNRGYRYSWTDAAGTSCGSTPGTRTRLKPQCQMIFLDQTNWTGVVNTDWFNAGNWTGGVPNKNLKAAIPAGLANYPIINNSPAACDDITIANGASLTISGTNTLEVYGNWSNDGSFTCNSSTVDFLGMDLTNINGSTNQVFYNLRNSNPAGITFPSGSYDIKGALYPEGGPITTNNSLRLLSDLNGTGRVGEVKSNCTYTLNMFDSYGDGWNGGYLSVAVDGVLVGYFSALGFGSVDNFAAFSGGTIELTYNSGSWEGENTFNLTDSYGNVLFSAGSNITTGLIYTGTSDCNSSDPFIGDVTVQRYLSLVNDGWRELSAPMPSKTLADWKNDGLIMSNFPGSNYPNFGWTSVYTYNENNANGIKEDGWVEATNITDALSPNKGHRVYIGTGNFTVNVQGDVNVGDYNFNLDYQNILGSEIAANENQKGWNLIGNPYPGTIGWDKISATRKVNVDDAFWIWSGDAGNYGVYVGGAGSGTLGVGPAIASGQAFWVHATSSGASLTTRENDKEDIDHAFVKGSNLPSYFSLNISSNFNSFSDEILVTYGDNFSSQLDANDALKLETPVAQAPSMFGVLGNDKLGVCSASNNEELDLPLVTDVHNTGLYTLAVNQFKNVGDRCIFLEDLSNGMKYLIDSTFSMSFNIQANSTASRFVIHSFNMPEIEVQDEECYGLNNGALRILSGGSSPYSFEIINLNNGSVNNFNPIVLPAQLTSLSPGVYQIDHSASGFCPVFSQEIVVESASNLVVSSVLTNTTCDLCEDGSIELIISGGIGPYQVSITNSMTDSLMNLPSGLYNIEVADANGCVKTFEYELLSDDTSLSIDDELKFLKIYPNPASNDLFVSENFQNKSFSIYDNTGRLIKNLIADGNKLDIRDISSGVYWLIVENISVKPIVFEVIK